MSGFGPGNGGSNPPWAMKRAKMEHHVKLNTTYRVLQSGCLKLFEDGSIKEIDLTFVDPPFNQGKDYKYFDGEQNQEKY